MNNINVLWVDDEIDLLKPHILFLEQKNYKVTTCNSGTEALEIINDIKFDCPAVEVNATKAAQFFCLFIFVHPSYYFLLVSQPNRYQD